MLYPIAEPCKDPRQMTWYKVIQLAESEKLFSTITNLEYCNTIRHHCKQLFRSSSFKSLQKEVSMYVAWIWTPLMPKVHSTIIKLSL